MRNTVIQYIFNRLKKHPVIVIIISVILGVLFFFAFRNITLKADYIDLLPPESEPVQTLKYLSEKLKGVGQFSIVLERTEGDSSELEPASDYIAENLRKLPEIGHVFYKIPRELIQKNLFLMVDTEDLEEIHNRLKEKIQHELWKDVPFFISLEDEDETVEFVIDDIIDKYRGDKKNFTYGNSDYIISEDKTFLVMFLKPNHMPTDVDKTGALIEKIREVGDAYKKENPDNLFTMSFAGTYVLSFDQKNAIYKDIRITSLIAMVLIFIAIIIFLKNFNYSLFLLYALAVGVLSTFGIAFITLGHINLITAFLIAILTGLGVNYGIHFLLRFKEERKRTTVLRALNHSFIKTGLASLTGALTTSVSFFSLSFSKFLGFKEFGMLASVGILITLLSTYIVVAAFVVIINKRSQETVPEPAEANEPAKVHGKFVTRPRILIISAVLTTVTLILLFTLKNLGFEYDSRKLEVQTQDSIKKTEMIQKRFNISTDPAIFYTYDRNEEKDFYQTVQTLMSKDESQIGNVITLSAFVKDEVEQQEKIELIRKMRREIETLPEGGIKEEEAQEKIDMFMAATDDIGILTTDKLPPPFRARIMVDDDGKPLYISQVFPDKILFDAQDMKRFVTEVKKIKGSLNTYFTTGMHVLYVYLIDTVMKESRIFLSLVFFIIFILLLIDFKKITDSLIAMLPLVFGVVWLLEIMSIFNISFNFMNIIVLPTILGTGVDNGVHIYHRYKDSKDIIQALVHTGKANFAMSLTVALGWSALFAARYQGLRTMAIVGVIGIMTTFIASVTIMPAMIILIDRIREQRLKKIGND